MADNKHTKGDLQQMQAVPLAGKILMTKRRIREWHDHFDGQVYVSFSGGGRFQREEAQRELQILGGKDGRFRIFERAEENVQLMQALRGLPT